MKPEKISPEALLDNGTSDKKIINFPKSIPGFEDLNEYVLLKEPRNPAVFILQSVKKPDISFPMVLPHTFGINYDIELTDEEAATIDAKDTSTIIVFLVLAKETDPGKPQKNSIVANIAGPVVINTESMKGYQKILTAVDYTVNIQS